VLRKSGRLGGVAGSVVEYVTCLVRPALNHRCTIPNWAISASFPVADPLKCPLGSCLAPTWPTIVACQIDVKQFATLQHVDHKQQCPAHRPHTLKLTSLWHPTPLPTT
jgi:hypothetical protein